MEIPWRIIAELGSDMGLDVVELVMAVEEEFDVTLSTEAQERIGTVGDLADAIEAELARQGRPANPTEIFARIKKLTVERLEVPPDKVTREATFSGDLGAD